MALRNGKMTRLVPRGVADTADALNSPPGAMASLSNLIPDPTTPATFICRPAVTKFSSFLGFTTPSVVSIALQVNGLLFGMVASARNTGYDEPFCYNLVTNNFVTVSGITSANVPTTQPASGAWTPPWMEQLVNQAVVCHPGFNETNGYFGYFDFSGTTLTYTGDITNTSNLITGNFPIGAVQLGYTITGTGIPSGTVVTQVANITPQTTGTTNGTTTISSVASTVGFAVGQQIAGAGIPVGTTITAIGSGTFTISQAATASASGVTLSGLGTVITMSKNATATTNNLSITIAGGTTAAPLWAAGNTTMNGLPSPPTCAKQFSNRIYFSCGNQLAFTDVLSLNRTDATQVLTIGDATPITALANFTLSTTTSGVLQGLLALKQNAIIQVTGDIALQTLALNNLNTASGTIAPRSVTSTPNGVFFMANDGIRIVGSDGSISDPDSDLRSPFMSALYPSRVSAAYNAGVYRISVQNTATPNTPWQEYWFDLTKGVWTGPHTFEQDLSVPYQSAFVVFNNSIPATMWRSEVSQVSGVGFTENGTPLAWAYLTPPMGEESGMTLCQMNASTLVMAFQSGEPAIVCTATDAVLGTISQASIVPQGGLSVWGAFTWGAAIWAGTLYGMRPHLIPWTGPIVYTKLVFQASGISSGGFRISRLQGLVQPTDYLPSP